MNSTEIATAAATDTITLVIVATAYGWNLIHRFADGADVWDGKTYSSEARARAAANAEWTRLRKATAAD